MHVVPLHTGLAGATGNVRFTESKLVYPPTVTATGSVTIVVTPGGAVMAAVHSVPALEQAILLKAPPLSTSNINDVLPDTKPVPAIVRVTVCAVAPVFAGIAFGVMRVMVGNTTYMN